MQQEDPSNSSDLGNDLANLVKALGPVFCNRFPNVRRAVQRLTGDVSDAAIDALIARLRRYRAHQQIETIREVARTSGLPEPVVARAFAEREAIDELLASALEVVANQDDGGAVSSGASDSTTHDWFDVYKREATDRSEGDLREAFARILAGEIQRPGTFSIHTIRVLGMLDQGTARLFRKAVSASVMLVMPSIGGQIVSVLDARIPSLGKPLGSNSMERHGLDYRVLTNLTEAGLLQPEYSSLAEYGPSRIRNQSGEAIPPDPKNPNLQFVMRHQGTLWLLIPTKKSLQGQPIGISGARFTRVGMELLRIVDVEPVATFTQELQQHFASQGYSMVPYQP